MTGASERAVESSSETAEVLLSVSAAAWLYGALVERQVLRGRPRDPELRRHVDALRRALVDALPADVVDGEVDAVNVLIRGERMVA